MTISATALPPLLVLTDGDQSRAAGRPLPTTVRLAVKGGCRAVLFREKGLDRQERRDLARALQDTVTGAGGLLLVGSDALLAHDVGAAGVHLAANDPVPGGRPPLVGRSCHNRDEILRAEDAGVDYATVSPVFETPSKPGYGPALGLDRLARLAEETALDLYALGGVGPHTAGECLAAGASGVACMGAVMGAERPAVAVAGLLAAIDGHAGVDQDQAS